MANYEWTMYQMKVEYYAIMHWNQFCNIFFFSIMRNLESNPGFPFLTHTVYVNFREIEWGVDTSWLLPDLRENYGVYTWLLRGLHGAYWKVATYTP